MDLNQLKTFVTVAETASLTRAAGLLYLSQPAVSAHIKQ
ncbi:LysR family transcriptional regulator, partial [Salmonella enterica]